MIGRGAGVRVGSGSRVLGGPFVHLRALRLGHLRLCAGGAAVLLGCLIFGAVPVFAAAPEAPEVSVEDSTAVVGSPSSEVLLRGVLNPGGPGEAGTYQFFYKASKLKVCKGAGGSVAPASPEMALGMEHEEVRPEVITGLTPGTEYAVCLVATNSEVSPKSTSSAVLTFTTPVVPQTPKAESATAVTATTATLHGELNPTGEAVTGYHFLYSTESSCANGGIESEQVAPAKVKAKTKVTAQVKELQPLKKYTVCLVATNEAGEQVQSTVETETTFKTTEAPATVDSEAVSHVTSSEATLEGSVNPNNQFTECHFQYGTTSVTENEVACTPELLKDTYGEQEVSPKTVNSQGQTVPAPVGVSPGATYTYRIVTKNAKGEVSQGPENTFDTFEEPEEENASAITGTTATYNGIIDPNHASEEGSYEFLYRESASECQLTTAEAVQARKEAEEVRERLKTKALIVQKRAPEPAGTVTGTSPQPVSAEATGLHPGATYTYCLAINNSGGKQAAVGVPVTFTAAPAAPLIETASSSGETAETAELHATINPDGAATSYHFEYDTRPYLEEHEAPHGQSTTTTVIPAGSQPVSVTATAVSTGTVKLEANTPYYWRVQTTNTSGSATSVEHVFLYSTEALELPDHRAYEMVTPPYKDGALIGDALNGFPPAIAENGDHVIALSVVCFDQPGSCTALRSVKAGEPVAFARTPTGWNTTPLAPPATYGPSAPWLVNAEQGTSLFTMPTGPEGEDEWYAGEQNGAKGTFAKLGPATPPAYTGLGPFAERAKAATSKLTHIVWEQGVGGPDTGAAWPFDNTEDGGITAPTNHSLYEYVGTDNRQPFLVGVEGGEEGGEPSTKLVNGTVCGSVLGGGREYSTRNALSADGRIVFFTLCGPGGELYARVDGETNEAHTDKLSSNGSHFAGASENGARAFFLEGEGLYESECTKECEKSGETRSLIDVSAAETGGEAPEVQGVAATSADGSHVYFVANGVLSEAANSQGAKAIHGDCIGGMGECNLYVYERDTRYPRGHLSFITSLPGTDSSPGHSSSLVWGNEGGPRANVTPEGRYLVFASYGNLTPDDTRTQAEGENAAQIYRYDAESGQLVRISIGNDGFDNNGNTGTGNATIVPASAGAPFAGPARSDPTMSNDGAYVYFQSPIALTPHAPGSDIITGSSQGRLEYAENVYEYHEGHVYLISDGRDVSNASTPCTHTQETNNELPYSAVCLLGTDATGHNVFFTTSDQLVPADTDTQLDIYDARVCGGEDGPCVSEPPPPAAPCNSQNCHGVPVAPPSLPAPSSASFSGEGNVTSTLAAAVVKPLTRAQKLAAALKACHKKKGRRRVMCEKHAKKKYGSAKKASHKGSR
jgi:hypothetical protein